MMQMDTIFALSSGAPPAAIGIIRISGPSAGVALSALAGELPSQRRAALRQLSNPQTGEALDTALILWLPGPATATGEDLTELHCHGGRAVIRAVEAVLSAMPGLRRASPGEFTRRAFENGRMDLAEAEALSDLLFAETEWQRRSALTRMQGALGARIEPWRDALLALSAQVEAELDFSDEDDVSPASRDAMTARLTDLAADMERQLAQPRIEKLQDGVRVVLGGPPNSGKSSLLNALVRRDAAIVSDIAGTTRDAIEVPVALDGIPFVFVDTAGLREEGAEAVEQIGIARAHDQLAAADLILWLGEEGAGPDHQSLIEIAARCDANDFVAKGEAAVTVSAQTGEGVDALIAALKHRAFTLLPPQDHVAVNARQAHLISVAMGHVQAAAGRDDLLMLAEELRLARDALDALTGRAGTEEMLDALFGKFCIGK
jgi:tRNA modification GTPase